MFKKTITYKDFDDTERTEDFYFHFTKAEVMELEHTFPGGLSKMLEKIVAEKDAPQLVTHFKRLILLSYGEKSPDGRRFIKTDEVRDAFAQTEAYSQLFMELSTNADSAGAWVNGIIPQGEGNKDQLKLAP